MAFTFAKFIESNNKISLLEPPEAAHCCNNIIYVLSCNKSPLKSKQIVANNLISLLSGRGKRHFNNWKATMLSNNGRVAAQLLLLPEYLIMKFFFGIE
jgi:hypothetical protein